MLDVQAGLKKITFPTYLGGASIVGGRSTLPSSVIYIDRRLCVLLIMELFLQCANKTHQGLCGSEDLFKLFCCFHTWTGCQLTSFTIKCMDLIVTSLWMNCILLCMYKLNVIETKKKKCGVIKCTKKHKSPQTFLKNDCKG